MIVSYDFHHRALDQIWYIEEQVGPAIERSVLLSALIATLLTCSPAHLLTSLELPPKRI